MQKTTVNPEDYVWVVIEIKGTDENFLGLENDAGERFVPVTASREDAQALLDRLPAAPQGTIRQIEATHKKQIAATAAEQDFAVYLVDGQGVLQGRLE